MINNFSRIAAGTSFIILAFGVSNILAQENRIVFGPGLVYGSEVENLGIKVDGYYTINEQFRAGLDFVFYLPVDLGNDVVVDYLGFNINGHYLFYSEDELTAYGLAGINFLRISFDSGYGILSNTEIGLNLGAGIEYAQSFGNLFGELKLGGLGGDANQLVIGAGVRFEVNFHSAQLIH